MMTTCRFCLCEALTVEETRISLDKVCVSWLEPGPNNHHTPSGGRGETLGRQVCTIAGEPRGGIARLGRWFVT